jgi:hypothetical protein
LAYSAAAIDLSEIHLRRQDPKAAKEVLITALGKCRLRGDPGALLVARIQEVPALIAAQTEETQ